MSIDKFIKITKIQDKQTDFAYWQSQPYAKCLAALEQIRADYNQWKYDAKQGFQRVYKVTKLT